MGKSIKSLENVPVTWEDNLQLEAARAPGKSGLRGIKRTRRTIVKAESKGHTYFNNSIVSRCS